MKYLLLLALSFGLLNINGVAQKNKKNVKDKAEVSPKTEAVEYKTESKRYGEKSGTIEYMQLTGARCQTITIIYFDNFGDIEIKDVFIQNESGEKRELRHTIIVERDGIETSWDVKNAVNGVDILKKEAKVFKKVPYLNYLKTPFSDRRFFKTYDYKNEGSEHVGKFLCEKYSVAPDPKSLDIRLSILHYKNIPLKASFAGAEIRMIKANFNTRLPMDKLNPPRDYKIVMEKDKNIPEKPNPLAK